MYEKDLNDVALAKRAYERVWMIDVRDSYFQSDPFAFLANEAVDSKHAFHAFMGVESRSIENCGWNSNWIKDCFGGQVIQLPSRSA